jgi:hypothetical protein
MVPFPDWYESFLQDKSNYYKTYWIPKRELARRLAGGEELRYSRKRIPESQRHLWRKISAPTDELRQVQVEIRKRLYHRRPSKFDCCVRNRNRFMANEVIAGKKVIIAVDIKDAFPSTNSRMILSTLEREKFDFDERKRLMELATVGWCLPQGSPCSPVLLNLVRKRLDYRMAGYIKKRYNGVMSVYVDNYYFASDDPEMPKCIPVLKNMMKACGYTANEKKIYIMRKGGRQGGLGLVASVRQDGTKVVQPPREYRNRLRAVLHNGVKRVREGGAPWPDLGVDRVRGMIENCKGSIHYPRFRAQMDEILKR